MALVDAPPRPPRTVPQEILLTVGGTQSLDAIDGLVLVNSGRAEIYGMVGETRCFLGEFGPGATLVGGGEGRLVILAPDGARLSVREGYGAGASSPDPRRAAESLETWIEALSEGVSRYAPPRPDLRALQPGETARLTAGEAASAGRGLAWLSSDAPALGFLGVVTAASPTVPVLPATWVVATAPCHATGSRHLDRRSQE